MGLLTAVRYWPAPAARAFRLVFLLLTGSGYQKQLSITFANVRCRPEADEKSKR